jgi:hypothetical protein
VGFLKPSDWLDIVQESAGHGLGDRRSQISEAVHVQDSLSGEHLLNGSEHAIGLEGFDDEVACA